MKIYSIVRIGNQYVVQAGEKSILKIASRRRAARLVTEAAELLELQADAQPTEEMGQKRSSESTVTLEPGEVA
jgi:hypothetical protein